MERLRGPTQTVFSLLELCLKKGGSLLGNKRVAENKEMGMVMKTSSILVYNGCPYN